MQAFNPIPVKSAPVIPAVDDCKALAIIRESLRSGEEKVVIVDDDPTGTQTVRDIPVYFEWTAEALSRAMKDPAAGFFISTNSRSMPVEQATEVYREIGANLRAVADKTGIGIRVISRSDSMLRGHFPVEVTALEKGLGYTFDGILLAPFFHEGGRVTVDNTHYFCHNGTLIPAAETEFARDPYFGYKTSHMPEWVEEKTGGICAAGSVHCLDLQVIREGGPHAVAEVFSQLRDGRISVINSLLPEDIRTAVAGAVLAESTGKRFIWRSAASVVQARLGQDRLPLVAGSLTSIEPCAGGLVIAGSYVDMTTRQIRSLMESCPSAVAIEVDTELLTGAEWDFHAQQYASRADEAITAGKVAVIYTCRVMSIERQGNDFLSLGGRIGDGLIGIVRAMQQRPAFFIAKGGITSHRLAHEGLQLCEARAGGVLLPGVPVWECGTESRWPGLPYVVFPGNVGADDALLEAVNHFIKP